MKRAGLCAGLVCCATVLLVAQQPQFRAATELVTIDVVATGADGRPVKDLTAADFEVLEDGVVQPVVAFSFFDAERITTAPPLARGVYSNDQEPGGLFAIVLDELGLSVLDIREVRRVFGAFLNVRVRPGDYVTVVRSSADSAFMLASSPDLARDVVANVTGLRDRGLGLEAPVPVETLPRFTDVEVASGGTSGQRSFDVLLDVVERFRPIQARRKAVIWVSRGGDINFRTMEALENGNVDGRDYNRFGRLLDTARAGNVAIYTLDPTGLQAPGEFKPDPPHDIGAMRDIAAATGGRPIVNANDLSGALERVVAENRAYYLLGYVPQTPATKPRKIEVRSRTAGVRLLHRSMYIPPDPKSKSGRNGLLESPLPVRDLPITMAPAVVARGRNDLAIVVPLEIGRDLPEGADVEYTVVSIDARGRQIGSASGRVNARGGRATARVALRATENTYQVRVAAVAHPSNLRGLAFAPVPAMRGEAAPARCGGLALQQQAPHAFRQFDSSQKLTVTAVVSAIALDPAQLAWGLGAAGGAFERTWPTGEGVPVKGGLWQVSLELQPPLPRGNAEIALLHEGKVVGEGCRTAVRIE